jgi:UDP-glucose:(heptosyl)LPS alpha-1,3-glucosyltransferase
MQLVPGSWALTRGGRERAFARAATDSARDLACDVVIGTRHLECLDLYWPHGGSHARSLAAARAARSWKPGSVTRIEHVEPSGRHASFVEFERALLDAGGARRVVCVSPLVERELAEDFPAARARLVLVENGVDLERFHPRRRIAARTAVRRGLGIDERSVMLAFCARQPILKGLPVLLAALSRLSRAPWTLVVAGPGDVAAWRKRARAAGIGTERVRVVAHADTAALFAAADLCVHPTWRDTSALVVLEALASGLPVITTSAAGEAHTVSAAGGSVIDQPGDVEALAVALETWIERVRARAVDHDSVRAAVAQRGEAAWLARLEHEVMGLAR